MNDCREFYAVRMARVSRGRLGSWTILTLDGPARPARMLNTQRRNRLGKGRRQTGELAKQPNIGQIVEEQLERAGIRTREELEAAGAEEA